MSNNNLVYDGDINIGSVINAVTVDELRSRVKECKGDRIYSKVFCFIISLDFRSEDTRVELILPSEFNKIVVDFNDYYVVFIDGSIVSLRYNRVLNRIFSVYSGPTGVVTPSRSVTRGYFEETNGVVSFIKGRKIKPIDSGLFISGSYSDYCKNK